MKGTLYVHPKWYDILHTPGTAEDADVLERMARRYVMSEDGRSPREMRWLEPGSGTGRFLRVLARRGAWCVGLEFAEEMVAYARERASRLPAPGRVRVVRGDMRRFTAKEIGGRVDVAFCLHNTARHMTTDAAMADHLRCVGRALRPGGVYIVGTSLAEGDALQPQETSWSAERGGVRVREVMQFEPVRRGRRWVERAHGVVLVSQRGREDECIPSAYDLWTGGVDRWRRVLTRAGMAEIAVTDAWGADAGARRGLYALRVLAPEKS